MRNTTSPLRAGDMVEVRGAAEILRTLDQAGALEGLPFMPEMLPFCGRRFRIDRRAEKTCVDGSLEGFREFRNNNVVFLEGLRCSGKDHEGCGRICMLFWKEAWLRKAPDDDPQLEDGEGGTRELLARLKTSQDPGNYFCQSSELNQATLPLSRRKRLQKCFREIRAGNRNVLEMTGLVLRPTWHKIRSKFTGKFPAGSLRRTPAETLDLQPGELVEVKSFPEILSTLDTSGKNRGLLCTFALRKFCGHRFRVKSRLDRMICENSGALREVRNTVLLDGVSCQCLYAFGGCPRRDHLYWREIWLKRVEPEPAPHAPESATPAA